VGPTNSLCRRHGLLAVDAIAAVMSVAPTSYRLVMLSASEFWWSSQVASVFTETVKIWRESFLCVADAMVLCKRILRNGACTRQKA